MTGHGVRLFNSYSTQQPLEGDLGRHSRAHEKHSSFSFCCKCGSAHMKSNRFNSVHLRASLFHYLAVCQINLVLYLLVFILYRRHHCYFFSLKKWSTATAPTNFDLTCFPSRVVLSSRPRITFAFKNDQKLMALIQPAKRPKSEALKGIEWFCMIDEKVCIDTTYSVVSYSGVKETAVHFGVSYVRNRRNLHNHFSPFANETKLNTLYAVCGSQP